MSKQPQYSRLEGIQYLVEGREKVDDPWSRGGMETRQEVSECDLVLRHEVVHHHLPLPQRGHTHHKEVGGQEEIKDLLPPGLPGDLEAAEGGQQLGAVQIAATLTNTTQDLDL